METNDHTFSYMSELLFPNNARIFNLADVKELNSAKARIQQSEAKSLSMLKTLEAKAYQKGFDKGCQQAVQQIDHCINELKAIIKIGRAHV